MKAWNPFCKLTGFEWGLWLFSLAVVALSFLLGGGHPLALAASLIGVTASSLSPKARSSASFSPWRSAWPMPPFPCACAITAK